MEKEDLLKQIAETGYNVGFGAKKHFATYDIICKAPNWIAFLSIAVGIFGLFIDILATKQLSAIFIVLGISGLFINFYGDNKQDYDEVGKKLTQLFNDLKSLYYAAKDSNNSKMDDTAARLKEIENSFYSLSISKHIFVSDWYAHYKFFWQHQIDWIDEQKNFKLWRDKMPLSFSVFIIIIIIALICGGLYLTKLRDYI
jgi:hypothetical protein